MKQILVLLLMPSIGTFVVEFGSFFVAAVIIVEGFL